MQLVIFGPHDAILILTTLGDFMKTLSPFHPNLLSTSFTLALLLSGVSFTAIEPAYAGPKDGGGGTAVVCFADNQEGRNLVKEILASGEGIPDSAINKIESVETLDLYEAKMSSGLDGKAPVIAEAKSGETYLDFARRVTSRYHSVFLNPEAKYYENSDTYGQIIGDFAWDGGALYRIGPFENSKIQVYSKGLKRINDEAFFGAFTENNCLIAQVAVQKGDIRDASLYIDGRIFNHPKNSETSKAALIIHEMVYFQERIREKTDSSNARRIVGLLMNNSDLTIGQFRDKLSKVSVFWPWIGVKLYLMARNNFAPTFETMCVWKDQYFFHYGFNCSDSVLDNSNKKILHDLDLKVDEALKFLREKAKLDVYLVNQEGDRLRNLGQDGHLGNFPNATISLLMRFKQINGADKLIAELSSLIEKRGDILNEIQFKSAMKSFQYSNFELTNEQVEEFKKLFAEGAARVKNESLYIREEIDEYTLRQYTNAEGSIVLPVSKIFGSLMDGITLNQSPCEKFNGMTPLKSYLNPGETDEEKLISCLSQTERANSYLGQYKGSITIMGLPFPKL